MLSATYCARPPSCLGPGSGSIPWTSATSSSRTNRLRVPLGLAVADADPVHHAVAGEPVVGDRASCGSTGLGPTRSSLPSLVPPGIVPVTLRSYSVTSWPTGANGPCSQLLTNPSGASAAPPGDAHPIRWPSGRARPGGTGCRSPGDGSVSVMMFSFDAPACHSIARRGRRAVRPHPPEFRWPCPTLRTVVCRCPKRRAPRPARARQRRGWGTAGRWLWLSTKPGPASCRAGRPRRPPPGGRPGGG